MKFVNYLLFNGNCREAFEFYAKVFDGEIVGMLTHRETPASKDVSEEWQDKIINAQLVIGDQSIMASDAPPQFRTEMSGFSVSVDTNDLAKAEPSSQRLPMAAPSTCRSARPSGPRVSAW